MRRRLGGGGRPGGCRHARRDDAERAPGEPHRRRARAARGGGEKPAKKSADAPEKAKKEDKRMSNPATMAGVDPLAGVMPCAGDSCEAPSGTFEARLELERALQEGENAADEPTLTKAIRDAVDVAITMCENGEDASQCAVAWEVVEELSSSASREAGRRRGRGREINKPILFYSCTYSIISARSERGGGPVPVPITTSPWRFLRAACEGFQLRTCGSA